MLSTLIKIKAKEEVESLIKSQLKSESGFLFSKQRFEEIKMVLCYGIISNFNPKLYAKISSYFQCQKSFDKKMNENNLFDNENNNEFKKELKKYSSYHSDYPYTINFYILTLNEYAEYIYEAYYDLLKYTNGSIYFDRPELFDNKKICETKEFGIQVKPSEIFNFDKYITYEHFGRMYECIVSDIHVNLHEIFYERIKND